MFRYHSDAQAELDRQTGGRLEADFSEVYRARRKYEELGGQSYSEYDQVSGFIADELQKIKSLRGFEDTRVQDITKALEDLGEYEQEIPGLQPAQGPLVLYDNLIRRLRPEHPDIDFKTTDDLRELAAERARQAYDEAQDISARAGGSTRFFGEAAAGMVSDIREPANIAGMMLTAPVAVEALAGSLVMKLGQLAVIEGIASGGSEYLAQSNLHDYYKRQGFSDEEIADKLQSDVLAAAAGGAVLAPAGYLAGKGIGKLMDRWLGDIQSGDPVKMRSALDEMQSHPSTTPEDMDAIARIMQGLNIERTMPDDIKASPSLMREAISNADEIRHALETGEPIRNTKIVDEQGLPRIFETKRKVDRFMKNPDNDLPAGTKPVENPDGTYSLQYQSKAVFEQDESGLLVFNNKKNAKKAAAKLDGDTEVIQFRGRNKNQEYVILRNATPEEIEIIKAEYTGRTIDELDPVLINPRSEPVTPDAPEAVTPELTHKLELDTKPVSENPSKSKAQPFNVLNEHRQSTSREITELINSGKYDETIYKDADEFVTALDDMDIDPELKAEVQGIYRQAADELDELEQVIACMRG